LANDKEGSGKTIQDLSSECEAYLKAGALPERAKPEAQTQQLLVTPLLELLGWFRKPSGDTRAHYVTEYGVAEQGVKWTDYALIIDDSPVVFVEAKQLFEELDAHVEQLISQISRFNRENPSGLTVYWGVLTNFQEIRIYYYDDPKNPVLRMTHSEVVKRWPFLKNLLSPNGLRSGELENHFRETSKRLLDEEFLRDLKRWRVAIANGYLKKNESLSKETLGRVSQRMLDRIMLIRVLENSGALPYSWLIKRYRAWQSGVLGFGKTFCETLRNAFREFWHVFDTDLFETNEDDEYEIEDDFLREVIKVSGHPQHLVNSYMMDSQTTLETKGIYGYNFGLLDVDVMGSVYERYLTFRIVIVDEPMRRVTIEESKEQRKKEGAYYTSATVVEYIVRSVLSDRLNSILKQSLVLVDGGRFEDGHAEIRKIRHIKVLDPAFGSGSFLLRVYDIICETYEKYNRRVNEIYEEVIHQSNQPRMTEIEMLGFLVKDYPERVLLENIYGVDKDPQAAEIAKLNLWARLLDRKSALKGGGLRRSGVANQRESQPFPDLRLNLSVGNSLVFGIHPRHLPDTLTIELEALARLRTEIRESMLERSSDKTKSDVLEQKIEDGFRELEQRRSGLSAEYSKNLEGRLEDWQSEPPLNWQIEFPEVFCDQGSSSTGAAGFDCIVGNPPYVNIVEMDERYRKYFLLEDKSRKRVFDSAIKRFDLYTLFMELGLSLLKPGGHLGFIVPDKFMYLPYAVPLRKRLLSETCIEQVFDLSGVRIFPDSTVNPVIIVFRRQHDGELVETSIIHYRDAADSHAPVERVLQDAKVRTVEQRIFMSTPKCQFRFALAKKGVLPIAERVRSEITLGNIHYVNWGLRTGTEELTGEMIVTEPTNGRCMRMIRGDDILDRYLLAYSGEYIIYDPDRLYNPMFKELFENPKIVIRKISGRKGLFGTYDDQNYYCFSTVIVSVPYALVSHAERVHASEEEVKRSKEFNSKYLLGVINSRVMRAYHDIMLYDGIAVTPDQVKRLPIPNASRDAQNRVAKLVDEILMLSDIAHKMVELVPVEKTLSLEEILASDVWGISALSDTKKPDWETGRVCKVGDLKLRYEASSIVLLDDKSVEKMKLSFVKDAEPQFKYLSLLFEKWLLTEHKRKFKGKILLPTPRSPLSKRDRILAEIKSKTGHDDLPWIRTRIEDLDRQIGTIVGSLFSLSADDMKIVDSYFEKTV